MKNKEEKSTDGRVNPTDTGESHYLIGKRKKQILAKMSVFELMEGLKKFPSGSLALLRN